MVRRESGKYTKWSKKSMKFFLSSVGRRIGLIELLRETYSDCEILAGDYLPTAAALNIADKKIELPYKIDEKYMQTLLDVSIKEKVDFVIPLIDTELRLFAKYRDVFISHGIQIMISSPDTVEIAMDKMKTYHFFKDSVHFETPYSSPLNAFNAEYFSSTKVVLKPISGSSGQGIYILEKEKISQFSSLMNLDTQTYMAQEFVDFDTEVTIDIFCYEDGSVAELCQRQRIKVRGGEVEQAKTIKDPRITEIIMGMADKLELYGIVNIQIMVKDNTYYLGEINARFGGGFPLSCKSGANLLEHLKTDKKAYYSTQRYTENFCMLRYDSAIYIEEEALTWSK